jgi:ribosome maturation factor RimP
VLCGVEVVEGADHVAIDLEGEAETALVPFAWIVDAKLILTDELLKRGAEKRAERLQNPDPEHDLTDEEEDA